VIANDCVHGVNPLRRRSGFRILRREPSENDSSNPARALEKAVWRTLVTSTERPLAGKVTGNDIVTLPLTATHLQIKYDFGHSSSPLRIHVEKGGKLEDLTKNKILSRFCGGVFNFSGDEAYAVRSSIKTTQFCPIPL
jgi:hypothetical protein